MLKQRATLWLLWPILSISALCQVQRLAIPATDVSINEHGVAKIKTYCLDYGRMGPTEGESYGHLLSGEDSAVIEIDGKEMSLQNAIREGIVELRTAAPSLADLREQYRALDQLGQSNRIGRLDLDYVRTEPLARQRELLREEQNPSALQIVNLSGKKLKFKSRNAVMGTADESAPSVSSLFSSAPSARPLEVQGSLWLQLIQQALSSIGYPVSQDGKLGPQTQSAIEKFQHSQDLAATGAPDFDTVMALRRVADERNLQSLNSNGDFVVLRVENRPADEQRYRVVDGSSSVIYSGNDTRQLIDKIVTAQVPKGTETKYLDLDGFTDKESDNLSRSFSTYADQSIRPILREEGITYDRDLVVSRGIRLETKDIEVTEVTSGPRAGWFRAGLHFFVRIKEATRDVTMDVYSRSKDRISEFVSSFGLNPGPSGFDDNVSIAQLVSRGRKRLREKYGSTSEFDVVIQNQTKFITVEVIEPQTGPNRDQAY